MIDSCKMLQSSLKHSIRFCGIFPNLKQNFIACRSSKVSDCIFEIYQLWQSGFSRVYSNCCCSCWFETEIIKIGQSSLKVYSNNILNFHESSTILNAWTKKSGNLLNAHRFYLSIYLSVLQITLTASLHRSKIPPMSVLDMTLNNLMVRFQ